MRHEASLHLHDHCVAALDIHSLAACYCHTVCHRLCKSGQCRLFELPLNASRPRDCNGNNIHFVSISIFPFFCQAYSSL